MYIYVTVSSWVSIFHASISLHEELHETSIALMLKEHSSVSVEDFVFKGQHNTH